MNASDIVTRRQRIEALDFRGFADHLRFGTASDRYAGWIGQIYPAALEKDVQSRSKRLGGKSFQERVLPVSSVRYYFEHFDVLELDFTFYNPLRNADLEPTPTFFVLQQYAEAAPDDARFLLKAPQSYFARKLRRSSGGKSSYVENPDFLNSGGYRAQFLDPASHLLGNRLAGVIFEQEYQRVSDCPSPEENVAEMDRFFGSIPAEIQSHIELRSEHLLASPYFEWLEQCGLGFVFSHWTWLPPIRKQWKACGGRFSAANGEAVLRLLTPLNVRYADAYAQAHPFDAPLSDLTESDGGRMMVLDATALAFQALDQKALLNVIANNRAWGNAPELARVIAERILQEEEKRSAGG